MRNFANSFLKSCRSAKGKRVQAPKRTNRKNANRISFESLERRQLLAVSTTYSLDFEQVTPLNNFGDSETSATSLANNGFAVSATHTGHIDINVYNTNLTAGPGSNVLTGTNSSIDQLTNSNLVTVGQDADSIWYHITDSTGAVVATADIGELTCSEADVAALTGGRFAVIAEDLFLPGDPDPHVFIRNADGTAVTDFFPDFTGAVDKKPSIAALDNGNFVVAWHREVGGNTEIWHAIYDPNGAVVLAPTILDNVGTVNRNVDLTATLGGYAAVYEDNFFATGTVDITVWNRDSLGNANLFLNVSNPSLGNDFSEDANPRVARLSNNMLVVGWENNFFGDTDNLIALYDPATNASLTTASILGGESIVDDVGDMSIAGSFNARINVFQTNITDSTVNGETRIGKRFSTSDGADDVITGDDLVDIMVGSLGNDTLDGGRSNDSLNGGPGSDTLLGGPGIDTLIGGADGDFMDGGVGSDVAFYAQSPSAVFIDLLFNTATGGHATGDTLVDIERLTGSEFDDTLWGGNADNTLVGRGGTDFLGGDDGKDQIVGGDGFDTLYGGNGVDTLRGGNDADTFRYVSVGESGPGAANRDRIVDFTQAQFDIIDVSAIDGQTGNPFSGSFTFIGNASFTAEGQIRAFQQGGAAIVQFNTTGAGGAEMEIVLRNFTAANLVQGDFLVGASFMGWYGGDGSSDGSSDGPGFSSMSVGFDSSASGPQFATMSNQAGSYTLVSKTETSGNRLTGSTNSQASTQQDLIALDSVFATLS